MSRSGRSRGGWPTGRWLALASRSRLLRSGTRAALGRPLARVGVAIRSLADFCRAALAGKPGAPHQGDQTNQIIGLAIESAPAAMIMVDAQGTIVMVNALTERVLGYSRSELVGRPVELLMPARVIHRHRRDRTAFLADPRHRPMGAGRDLFAKRKDGSEIPVEIGLAPIQGTGGTFVLAAITDITERKRTESLLRARTAELEQVLDLIPAAVWISRDPECRNVLGNSYASALLGVNQGTNLSQTPGDEVRLAIRHFHGGRELAPDELPMQRAAATGLAQLDQELEVALPDGRRITMLGGAVPLTDDRGNIRGVVSAFSDISERKDLERQRAEMLGREQVARAELERASRLKDEFLAVLSHELRTPLTAILGYTHLLTTGQLAPDRADHALQVIGRNAEAQARLIASLLDLSRVLAGKLELDLRNLDLAAVVAAAADAIAPDAASRGIRVEVEKPVSPLMMRGDADRLQQVFWNLLSNAVKFTPRGGSVRVAVFDRDGERCVQVNDSGQGIRPDLLPRVFDRFQQGEGHARGAPGGLGLGLALVRELVDAHGGTVDAASGGEGLGSTFTVTLPREPSSVECETASMAGS